MNGLQCMKSLYLHKHHPDLKDDVSEEQQAKFDAGHDVGELAQQLFPDGSEVPYEGLSLKEQLEKTQYEIAKGTKNIYEAAFQHNNVFCKVDILHRGKKGWEMYEVKSGTKLKDVYEDDIAFQYYVLKGSGLDVSEACLVHINRDYVRDGDVDVFELFAVLDITETVRDRQEFIRSAVREMQDMLVDEMPEIEIGPHCSYPYECDFHGHCWGHIPEHSVFSIGGKLDRFALYERGIVRLEKVPVDVLNKRQKMQVEGLLEKKDHVDRKAVNRFLNTLWYPLAFFDFETTMMLPVPLFDGTRPYQGTPFQYSLHVLHEESAELEHFEYLGREGTDPREDLCRSLVEQMPPEACVLTWNMNFEKGMLKCLADRLPEYGKQLNDIIKNVRDLMTPFKARHVYLWQFNGSASLKSVLPAMVPELSYDELDISDGSSAADAWISTWQMKDTKLIKKTRRNLLEYCRLDTLAMVKILEKLRSL